MAIDFSHPGETLKEAVDRLDIVPLPPEDPRYVDCSVERGKNVVAKMEAALWGCRDGKYVHQIFTGFRGDGKSTELNRFIKKITDGGKYRPLYFNAESEFDLNDFKFPDLLLGIATVVFNRLNKENLPLDDALLKKVANWFGKIVEEVEQKRIEELHVEAGAGIPNWFKFVTAKLVGTIKTGGERRKKIRTEFDQEIIQLLTYVDELLLEANRVSRAKDERDLVLIFDNLDRLAPEPAYNLFYHNGGRLANLKCHFFYVAPISLVYGEKAKLDPALRQFITMKMVPVCDQQNKPLEGNISHLRQLLAQRFVPEKIMVTPGPILRKFILASGGHLRDLIRFLHQACTDAYGLNQDKITEEMAQRVINEICEEYQQEVRQEDFYNRLIKTYREKKVVVHDDITRELLYRNLILVYDDQGADWFDVHPVLAQGKIFKDKERAWAG